MGYLQEYCPDHPLATRMGYMMQHRLVAEAVLGRRLLREEVVHHEDENKQNNSPENLWLFPSQAAHLRHHKRNSPRYSRALLDRLLPLAKDPSVSLPQAGRALGVSVATVRALLRLHSVPWSSPALRELTEEQARAALQGRTTVAAASLLGVHHMTLRLRFPHLLTTRVSPGFLDAHKEAIRSLAREVRADAIGERFACNPQTVKNAIQAWARQEPDAWSDVLAFQRSRRGIRWSRGRKA